MSLILDKKLIVLDLETTGTQPKVDRIVQIGVVSVSIDGTEVEWSTYINPGVSIPPGATEVHHITNEMVANSPSFSSLASVLARKFEDVHWAGFNLQFDLGVLEAEFTRCRVKFNGADCKIADAWGIYKMMAPRGLENAVKEYCGEEAWKEFCKGAHDALVDSRWSYRVLKAQVARHPELPNTIEGLHKLVFETPAPGYADPDKKFKWVGDELIVAFGKKHDNRPLREVAKKDPGFLEWMVGAEFGPVAKRIASDALTGKFPVREKK